LAASGFTAAMLAAPKAFIATLAGLAMLRVLHAAFSTAFRERFPVGALASFLVTVADLPILGIGAPFWGLVVGIALSWAMERGDFSKA
jgi:benzoate membrane transport protein